MGLSGISPTSLLLILMIIVLLFGTTKIRQIGGDLGAAFRNFKRALEAPDDTPEAKPSVKQHDDE